MSVNSLSCLGKCYNDFNDLEIAAWEQIIVSPDNHV